MSFKDTNILIVGGLGGIGRSVADRLLASDASLWCTSRQTGSAKPEGNIRVIPLDVLSEDVNEIAGELPDTLHGLVYCPGTINLKPFRSLKPDDFRKDLEVNLIGAVKVLKIVQTKLWNAGGASVVLFSTVAAQVGMNFHASIAAAKAAVEGFAISLAAEWAEKKVRIKEEVANLIGEEYSQHPGRLDLDKLPATSSDAQKLWSWAKKRCLPWFGPYEDAMSFRSDGLFHTRISSLLNIHRLLPSRVLSDVIRMDLPLASKEGFIRQILGWREFVRHIHMETDGFRKLPSGRPPVSHSLGGGGYKHWQGQSWRRPTG